MLREILKALLERRYETFSIGEVDINEDVTATLEDDNVVIRRHNGNLRVFAGGGVFKINSIEVGYRKCHLDGEFSEHVTFTFTTQVYGGGYEEYEYIPHNQKWAEKTLATLLEEVEEEQV